MARQSRTFRIFVSSTFSDLKEERNALQREVFPKLRELCMSHGCRFQAIDLRWGIREEATLDQQTMKICLEEIARCQRVTPRPNFIVLLGDRYGWRPLPYEIPADEFEQILKRIGADERALLEKWYWRDDNAVPPVYDLQPRTGEYVEWATWEKSERKMRSILLKATADMDLSDEQRIKYYASATEQEIVQGALNVANAHEHVFCFFRSIVDLPHDERARDFMDLGGRGGLDEESNGLLEDLKSRLRNRLEDNVAEYGANWSGNGVSLDHIDRLCADVLGKLTRVLEEEIAKLEEVDPLEQEIKAHDEFCKDRAKFFTGRVSILEKIADYIEGDDNHPLVIYGESGSGKTALIAEAVGRTQERHPNAKVLSRFVGATPDSSDGRALLESLCQEISDHFGFANQKSEMLLTVKGSTEKASEERRQIQEHYSSPTEYSKLAEEFRNFLTRIPSEENLTLFLDALDQLSSADYARSLDWLPSKLPENVRLIFSTPTLEFSSILERQIPVTNRVQLDRMSVHEGADLLDLRLADKTVRRTLQEHQKREVLSKFETCGLPFYLTLAFEEARKWKSYSEATTLSSDVPGLIRDLYAKLSLDGNHGKILVSRALGYLAAARNGLTEDEIIDVLSRDKHVFRDFVERSFHAPPEKRLSAVVWLRLHSDLEPYLTERAVDGTPLLGFYHRQFGDNAVEEFLTGETKHEIHSALAEYFVAQEHQFLKDGKRSPNVRKVFELPYQQTRAKLWDDIEKTLCDLLFVEAKCAAGMPYDLITDYNAVLDQLPEAQEERCKQLNRQARARKYINDLIAYARRETDELQIISSVRPWTEEEISNDTHRIINDPSRVDRLRSFSRFVGVESRVLMKFPDMPGFCYQYAYNSVDSGPVASAAQLLVEDDHESLLFLRHCGFRPPFNPHPAVVRTLEGHSNEICEVSLTPDGRRAVSGSFDKTLRLWDLETGACLRALEGHTDSVVSVTMTPDARIAVSGGADNTIRVWDLQTGECMRILEGHTDSVVSVTITPDAQIAVSASRDNTLRIWDLETGQCMRALHEFNCGFRCVRVAADGTRAISGGFDNYIRVWDLESGICMKAPLGHSSPTASVSVTSDGRIAVSGRGQGILCFWDLGKGQYLKFFDARVVGGTLLRMNTVGVTPDGTRVVLGYSNSRLCVWDLEEGQCLKTLERNDKVDDRVMRFAYGTSPFLRCYAQFLRSWVLWSAQGHCESVGSVNVTPDGRRAVSGSYDNTLRVWDLETGECVTLLEGHSGSVASVSVTPDGTRAVSGSFDKTLRIWDLETGACLRALEGHSEGVISVSVTPDGRKAVSGSYDNTLRVWDLQTGECLRTLEGHSGFVESVSVISDGTMVVSGSFDSSLRAWDLQTGVCVGIHNADDHVTAIAVSKGNPHLVYGTANTTDIMFLVNSRLEPPIVTATRLWSFGKKNAHGRWGDAITTVCPWCNERFHVRNSVIDTIHGITRDSLKRTGRFRRMIEALRGVSSYHSPCLELPEQAWDDTNLLSKCELCHQQLKFNPFLVDSRELEVGPCAEVEISKEEIFSELGSRLRLVALMWVSLVLGLGFLFQSPWSERVLVSSVYGFVFTYPVLAYQVWRFVSPGLRKSERSEVLVTMTAAPSLLILAIPFAAMGDYATTWLFEWNPSRLAYLIAKGVFLVVLMIFGIRTAKLPKPLAITIWAAEMVFSLLLILSPAILSALALFCVQLLFVAFGLGYSKLVRHFRTPEQRTKMFR